MRRLQLAALVVWAPLLVSCSLMGLGDFTVPRCTADPVGDAQCQREFGPELPDDCVAWQCVPDVDLGHNACQRITGERCDNADNDCDGLIDEGDADGAIIVPNQSVIAATLALPRALDVGTHIERGALLAWSAQDNGGEPNGDGFSALQSNDLSAGEAAQITYSMNTEDAEDFLNQDGLRPGCPLANPDKTRADTNCRVHEVAVGSLDFGNFYATSNNGQLRLGFSDEVMPADVVLRGPRRRSSTYLGVRTLEGRTLNTTTACQDKAAEYDATFDLPAGHGDACTMTSECSGALVCTDLECVETVDDRQARTVTERQARLGELGAVCGVAHPTLDVIDGPVPQALVAFNSGPGNLDSCPDLEVDVEVIAGYHFEERRDIAWVDGSNEGEPQVIGSSLGGGAPAVTALRTEGYFVGHGDAAGSLALHFVPAPVVTRVYDGTSTCPTAPCSTVDPMVMCPDGRECRPNPDDGGAMACFYTSGDCLDQPFSEDSQDRAGNETDPLPAFVDFPPIPAEFGGPVDDVAIALGAREGDVQAVGVTWREGRRATVVGGRPSCDTTNEVLGFRLMLFDVSSGAPAVMDTGTAVRLNPNDANQGPPAIGYMGGDATHGFRVDTVGEERVRSGGWFVAWRDRSGTRGTVVARRLSEVDGQLVDADELLTLSGDIGAAAPDGASPAIYRVGGELHFAYLDRSNSQLVGGTFTCGGE